LVGRARAGGLQLTGEGGLLQQLTKRVLESALEGEITDHLGYDKHDPAGRGTGNSRNGVRSKTVLTDVGEVTLDVPPGSGREFRAADRGQAAEAAVGCGRDGDLVVGQGIDHR
jgi:transposase-like protein